MKKGFTLIELLIVIAVISILIGIALPRFKGMQDEGNIAKATGELRTLKTAVESYYIHNNSTFYVMYSVGAAATGSATITNDTVVETSGTSCIYAANTGEDTQP